MSKSPDTVTVYPKPSLPEGSFVPGLPVEGLELTRDEAAPLLASGVVTTTKPPANPADEPEG